MKIQPVILCGGAGTRLWPLSREQHPKQLLPLAGELSLLQETLQRLEGMALASSPPLLLCREEYRFLVADQLRPIGVKAGAIVLEPAGRGTAPALTLGALHASGDGDRVLLVMPSDHVIANTRAFHEAVRRGVALAADGLMVTFGVPPVSPETGYGYMRVGAELAPRFDPPSYGLDSFVEKPDPETARHYVASGAYLWNSGIFAMRGAIWLDALSRLRPDMLAACELAHGQGQRDGDFYHVDARAFENCPQDSIDYAVMERIGSRRSRKDRPLAAVVRLDAGWSDVGAWDALWQVRQKNGDGNVVHGDVCAVDTRQSLLIAQHRLLGCVGLDNVVVIETPDAVMVAHRDRAQEVRKIVARLKSESRPECRNHRKVHRPWGSYEGVDRGERFQVKRIIVNPGASLSLQIHYHRAEHWIVVKGTARVTRGDQRFLLTENQSTYIPIGVKHRLGNPGKVPLEIIEVQSGAYLGEDDIVRIEDSYGRAGGPAAGTLGPASAPAAGAIQRRKGGA